jgi:hypothetical protein
MLHDQQELASLFEKKDEIQSHHFQQPSYK